MNGLLCDWQIKQYISSEYVIVSPYDESLINPASLDVRLGTHFTETAPCDSNGRAHPEGAEIFFDPTDKNSFRSVTEEYRDQFFLNPGAIVIASMMEDITLPGNISAKLFNKSSLARLGLVNSPDACWIDAGWSGVLSMELFNSSKYVIKLTPGMKIGQLVFFEHQSAEKPYKGRYLRQAPGAGSLGI
jgi:dCTP deaminase